MRRLFSVLAAGGAPSCRTSTSLSRSRAALVLSTFACGGCGSPSAPPSVVEVQGATGPGPSVSAVSGPTRDTPVGRCQVKGTKLPYTGCEAVYPVLSQSVGGSTRKIAVVRGDADVVLAFEGSPAKLTLSATTASLRARGDVDPDKTWIPLARSVEVLGGHGKVFAGAPVLVKGVRDQVEIEAWIGIGSKPATTSARVACDDLVFAPREVARIDAQSQQPPGAKVLQPKGPLHLFDAPGGRALLEIVPGEPSVARPPGVVGAVSRAANLVPLEKRGGFTRVAFDAPFVALQGWVPDGEVMEDEAQGFGGGIGCGTGSGSPRGKSAKAIKDAPLLLGEPGGAPAPVELALRAHAEVVRFGNEGSLSRISLPRDAIQPPDGSAFWVESSVLEDVTPKP